jgi:hypothetical protein
MLTASSQAREKLERFEDGGVRVEALDRDGDRQLVSVPKTPATSIMKLISTFMGVMYL